MIGRIGPVDRGRRRPASSADAKVYRSDRIPAAQTGGIAGYAARAGPARHGRRDRAPAAPGSTRPPRATRRSVLGAARRRAARASARPGRTPGAHRRAVVHRGRHPGPGAARAGTGHGGAGRLAGGAARTSASTGTRRPSTPARPRQQVEAVRGGAGGARPTRRRPTRSQVSRPSDALAAKQATDQAFTGAAARPGRGGAARRRGRGGQHDGHLGAGTPRRDRPAPVARAPPGARSGPSSSPSRCCCRRWAGWAACCSASLVTAGYAASQGWPTVVPAVGDWPAASARPCVIGAVAGLYPAMRAARLSPTEALATP